MQLTYNERNLLGNGCYERTDDGLSNFGVDAVKEMNRLGILIDLSHVGDRTTLDAADLSETPLGLHPCQRPRLLRPSPRNKANDALKLIAEGGGVIGANAFPPFFPKGFDTTVSDYLNAIEDLVEKIGINHVGRTTFQIHGYGNNILFIFLVVKSHDTNPLNPFNDGGDAHAAAHTKGDQASR